MSAGRTSLPPSPGTAKPKLKARTSLRIKQGKKSARKSSSDASKRAVTLVKNPDSLSPDELIQVVKKQTVDLESLLADNEKLETQLTRLRKIAKQKASGKAPSSPLPSPSIPEHEATPPPGTRDSSMSTVSTVSTGSSASGVESARLSTVDASSALLSLFGGGGSTPGSSAKSNSTEDEKKEGESQEESLEIKTPPQLLKYEKLKKMMPPHVVANRMKMDGISKMLIAQFEEAPFPAEIPPSVTLTEEDKKDTGPTKLPPLPEKLKSRLLAKGVDLAALDKKKGNESDSDDDDSMFGPYGLPKKRKIKPTKKMKRLHWTVLDPKIVKDAVWRRLDDTLVKINKTEFELTFQFRTPKPADAGPKAKKPKKTGGEMEKINFVPPKRSQQVQIGLSSSQLRNLSVDDIKVAIVRMDDKVLGLEAVEKLCGMAPTEEEQREAEKQAEMDGVVNIAKQFGKCELFFHSLMDLPELTLRVELWYFSLNLKSHLFEMHGMIKKLEDTCKALLQSEALREILQIILAFGNYMNGGTHSGCAYGFSLDSLRLLPGVKTFDNSMTMNMYLYRYLVKTNDKLLRVFDDCKCLKESASMESDYVDKAVAKLEGEMDKVRETISHWTEDFEDVLSPDDRFIERMTDFLASATPQIEKLVKRHKKSQVQCAKVAKYFGYDLNETGRRIETLFKCIQSFLDDLEKARDDLHKLEEDRERKRKRLKRKRAREKAAAERKKKKKKGAGATDSDELLQMADGASKSGKRTSQLYSMVKKLKKTPKRSSSSRLELSEFEQELVAAAEAQSRAERGSATSSTSAEEDMDPSLKPDRAILKDLHKRRATREIILSKVGRQLTDSLKEKSELIEAVNDGFDAPDKFKKHSVRRKVSVAYAANVQNVRSVPKGRMRLPTLHKVKALPRLPSKKGGKRGVFSQRQATKNAAAMAMAYSTGAAAVEPAAPTPVGTPHQRSAAAEAARAVGITTRLKSGDRDRADTPSRVPTLILSASKTETVRKPSEETVLAAIKKGSIDDVVEQTMHGSTPVGSPITDSSSARVSGMRASIAKVSAKGVVSTTTKDMSQSDWEKLQQFQDTGPVRGRSTIHSISSMPSTSVLSSKRSGTKPTTRQTRVASHRSTLTESVAEDDFD